MFDAASDPHLTADELSPASGLAKTTMSSKAKQVRDLLKMDYYTPEFLRENMIAKTRRSGTSRWTAWSWTPGRVPGRGLPARLHPHIPALGPEGTVTFMDEINARRSPG